jgi:hypothetical protein
VVIAACSIGAAQQDSVLAQPGAWTELPSVQNAGAQSSGAGGTQSANQVQNDSSKKSTQDAAQSPSQEAPADQPNHSGMVNSTVDTMRRLPAQWFLGSYVPANEDLKPLSLQERGNVYVRQTYLTGASYLKRLFGAGVDQARGAPREWGGGFGGYGKRFGSRYGEFIIQNSLAAAGNAALGYEPRYNYCRCTGFWPRTKHAIARNFYTYNFTELEKRPQIPLYVGAFGAGAIAGATWRPARENPWKDGVYSAASQAGFGSLSNWLQEFALDIGHVLSPKRRKHGAGVTQSMTDPAVGP